MRREPSIPHAASAAVALGFVAVAVAWPIMALVAGGVGGGGGGGGTSTGGRQPTLIASFDAPHGLGELALKSLGWALLAAAIGAAIAWPAARILKRERSRAIRLSLGGLVLLPLVLPPWLLYAAAWLSTGPGTMVGDMAERADAVGILRAALLILSTSVWSGALVFAVLLVGGAERDRSEARLLELDRASVSARLRSALVRDVRPLVVGMIGSTIVLFGETTAFDLAQVTTFGFELRSLDALGATSGELLSVAWPTMLAALVAGISVPWLAGVAGDRRLRRRHPPAAPALASWSRPLALLVATPSAVLLALLAISLASTPRKPEFVSFHGSAALTTVGISLLAALLTGTFAVALRVALDASAASIRRVAVAAAVLAVAAGVLPATITARALEAAYNRDATAAVYDGAGIVLLALLGRALFVGGVAALALVGRESRSLRRLRRLDGDSLRATSKGLAREIVLAGSVAAAVAFSWSLGELIASGRVLPPGLPWLATDLLNAIHYQRPETVFVGAALLIVAALPVLVVVLRFLARLRSHDGPPGSAALSVALAGILLVACGRSGGPSGAVEVGLGLAERGDAPEVTRPLDVVGSYSGVGRGPGQFNGPRVLAVDADRRSVYVVDKDARVQRFDDAPDPSAQWRLPKFDRGKPTGASVAPDGSLLIADTHEHRIVAASPDGEIRWTLGSYGREHGEFIYPTDVAFAPDGRMFVSEYGGNDRVQVFDAERRFLYAFGGAGDEPGRFQRPQAMVYDGGRDELYVADVGNHRIQVLTGDGEYRRTIGRPGRGPGELCYPFGLVLEIDGMPVRARDGETPVEGARTLVVAEHSNHRIQRLDAATGAPLLVAGGFGREPGRLRQPWAIEAFGLDADGRPVFAACDHGNSRIVFFRFEQAEGADAHARFGVVDR